jgi:type IV pilus assembly protein PilW
MMRRRVQAGLTLIELMIAILISMILSIAVMKVMSTFEGKRRTLGSSSDLDSAGNLAMFQLDHWIRSAGTGLVQGNAYTYGCRLFASKSSTQLLPLTASLPAPFTNTAENSAATTTYRLAPVVIVSGGTTPAASGQASDVLVVMASGNEGSQVPSPLTSSPTASSLPLANVTEFQPSDLLLVTDQQMLTTGPQDCMVSQADPATPTNGVSTTLSLSGTYYASSIGTRALTAFTFSSMAIDLGGATTTGGNAPPSFQVVGVGDNNTLYSYDLLAVNSPALQAQAEGVFEMHAVYGINSTGNANNVIDQWVDATSASAYSADKVTAGTFAAAQLLKNIRAVHVAIIMRTSLPERDPTGTPSKLTYFSNVPGMTAQTRTMSTAEQAYRYRVIETTIPVRNNQY